MNGRDARGASLWLMPEGEPRDRLARVIARLAERFSTPPFPPHLTLLPGIVDHSIEEAVAASRALAAALRPLRVRLGRVEGRDEFFRCLFVRAELDDALAAAHAAAARAFGCESDPGFMPHLSLVYGVLPETSKQELAGELADLGTLSFEAARLHLWHTEGPVPAWREVGAFDLAGR